MPHKRTTFRDHCLASNSFDSPALHNHDLAVCKLVKDRSCKFNVFSLITKYKCMTTACCHTEYRCHVCPVVFNERSYACSYTLSTLRLSLSQCPLTQQLAPVFGGKVKSFGYHFYPWCSGRHVKDCGVKSQLYNIAGWATESESHRTMESGIIFVSCRPCDE